jgi:single-stranded-DNA-specific exonuclease
LPKGQEKWLLDLVAFGTVCDVVTLRDENRMNVFWGLQVLQKTRRTGLLMLAAVTKIEPKLISARTLGFVFGPRLNASGRLETAQVALDLLLATDRKKALGFAEELHAMNAQRRAEQDRIFHEAKEQALEHEKDAVIIVSDPSWNHGIVGIVAAKLLEAHHKPAFVLQELPDGTAKGSARSFGDFSAVAAIRATDDLLLKIRRL